MKTAHGSSEISDTLIAELQELLVELRDRYANRPAGEMEQLLLLALEREEIVAIGYREAMIRWRLERMPLDAETKELIAHAMAWVWQDEAMHVVYVRGALVQLRRKVLRFRAAARAALGQLGGWTSSMQQHVQFREAPIARSLSSLFAAGGIITGAVPREVRNYLRYRPFREYCLFNVAAERTAILVYERMLTLANGELHFPLETIADLDRVRSDEERHELVFRAFAEALTEDDSRRSEWPLERLRESLAEAGEFFLPLRYRSSPASAGNPFGRGGTVVVRTGRAEDKLSCFRSALEAVGIEEVFRERCAAAGQSPADLAVVVKPSFMMAYSHRDRTPFVDPEFVQELGRVLRKLGARNIAVVEATKVYERFFRNREISFVAREFGFDSPDYRIEDLGASYGQHRFRRGIAQDSISRVWADAGLRINISKMRSHPIERALLCVANMEGLGPNWSDFIFSDRQANYATAILMVHDEFPAHLSLLDGFMNAPDGPLGVIGSVRPRQPLRIYAARDPLALDLVAARHMGMREPLESPLLRTATHWFGNPTPATLVDGPDERIPEWHGPCHNDLTALFSLASNFAYRYCSGRGSVFVPQMDPELFPPVHPPSFFLKALRGTVQRMFALHHR